MAKVEVLDWKKKKVGEVDVPSVVVETPVKKDILHTLVRWQLMSRRQGTHATKTRTTINGGGKKPFKQKGTGNARQGSSRSPIMEGGAVTHGPQPRDYSYSLPRGVKQAGLKTALSHLYKEGRFFVVDSMTSKDGKTKELVARLKSFGLEKALLIDDNQDDMFKRASKNIPRVRYNNVGGVNVYDLLKYDAVVFTKDSVNALAAKCGVK